ncbi:hypothetical protein R6Q59_016544 [Mikania micrantha]
MLLVLGFAPKMVQVTLRSHTHYQAEVFTFTSGAWRSISMKTLPCHFLNNPVVINGVIHWIVFDLTRKNGEENRMITFDLTIEEFGEVDLPVQVVGCTHLDISKLNDSLVVLHYHSSSRGGYGCDIWMMLNPKSSLFTKLYTVKASPHTIVGFRKNGQPLIKKKMPRPHGGGYPELLVYEPNSEHAIGVGIFGSVFMTASYTESLLLLNHPDSIIAWP